MRRTKNSTLIMGSDDINTSAASGRTATQLLSKNEAAARESGNGSALGIDRSLMRAAPPPPPPPRRGLRRRPTAPSPLARIKSGRRLELLSDDGVDAGGHPINYDDNIHSADTKPVIAPFANGTPRSMTPISNASTMAAPLSQRAERAERAPASNRFESQWFNPSNQSASVVPSYMPAPLLADLEERKGWVKPEPSRGLAFAMVSLVLVGVAAAGTFFFLSPGNKTATGPEPISTTHITSADTPAPAPAPAGATATTDTATAAAANTTTTATAPTVQRTMTPSELPTASLDGTTTTRKTPIAATPTAPPMKTSTAVTTPQPPQRDKPLSTSTPAPRRSNDDSSLPDLDRAAKAAGMTPAPSDTNAGTQPDDNFATPAPTADSPAPATPEPAPSEVVPDLEIKR